MKQQGLTLVELMISLALALVLTLGVMTLLTTSQRSYQTQRELALIQENAVFALNFLAEPLREVGYARGCAASTPFGNAVLWPTGTPNFNLFTNSIRSWRSDQLPAGMQLTPQPLPGRQVLQIQGLVSSQDLRAAVSTQGNSARVDLLNSNHGVVEGDLMMLITDSCEQMTLFVAKNAGGHNQAHIVMNTGTVKDSPLQNCTRHLMGNYDCSNHASASSNQGLPNEADVFRVRNDLYFVANSTTSGQPSLFRHDLVRDQTHELVPGVDLLLLTYMLAGNDTYNGMRLANRTAVAAQLDATDNDLHWQDVIGVELHYRMLGSSDSGISREYRQFVAMRNLQAR